LPNPVENVDTITFDYTYDPAGNVANATRTLGALDDPALPDTGSTPDAGAAPSVTAPDPTPAFPSVLETPDVDSRDYTYDSLNRLIGSETSKGNTAEYSYDPAGNRVQATTTTDAGTTDVTASFNEANQLTGSTSNGASSSYGYDGNGNRTTQNENDVTTDFSYQTDNRLTGVSRDGRSTSYAYDGTGRQLNTTETSGLGSQTTKSVWNGTSIVQQSNPASGTSTLMRDAFGEVALQTADGKDASWALLDGLGTTAAQAVGGSVSQLSTFDDWGNQSFDTIGWNSAVNYTGETTDAGYGLNNYYSRTYDPTTGSWMSQDSWRGLLDAPQTLARYGYVTNSPSTFTDYLGYSCGGGGGRPIVPMCSGGGSPMISGPIQHGPIAQMISANDDLDSVEWSGPSNDGTQDPSDDYSAIPARHVQGFDEGFPGYIPMLPDFKGGFGTGIGGGPGAAGPFINPIVDEFMDKEGRMVPVRDTIYAKIWNKHKLPQNLVAAAVHSAISVLRQGDTVFESIAELNEIECSWFGFVWEPTGQSVYIRVVIDYRIIGDGNPYGVVTAYCVGYIECPAWVSENWTAGW
jgi:RHS repeat-associated protein